MSGPEQTPELDERKAAILKTVVTDYVETAQPVGSSQVARDPGIEVSPATIRSDMASLERDGYLTHPHTSAGRIPTDKGYRFFVDHLTAPSPLGEAKQEQVSEFFSRAHGELERMLADTSRLLAQLTDSAAIVIGPAVERLVVRSALLVRISSHAGLLVIVLSNGVVDKHTIALAPDTLDSDIEAASTLVQQHFTDRSLAQLSPEGLSVPPSGRAEVDHLVGACRRAIEESTSETTGSDHVYVGGAARMVERFEAVDQVRAVLTILEQSFVVVSLLRDVLAHGQTVAIGSEHGVAPLAECSLVVAPFEGEDDSIGSIGILGPTRMDYPQALAAVAIVGQRLSRELQRG
ncbi:MAG TPA: heat-inducible transcriptional repressor HrcA [Acidimicrobiales bacterium]|nr:heat-inducible transcriptional repressor HrcA [Acidimicrobiales bacterium]